MDYYTGLSLTSLGTEDRFSRDKAEIFLLLCYSDGSVMDWDAERWNIQDWVEKDPCKTAIEQSPVDLGMFLYEQQTELCKFR